MDGLITGGPRVEEAAAPYLVAPLLTDHLDAFASAPEGFKRLRELVLNLAVRGRLVPQNSGDESAEKLLAWIRSSNNRVVLVPKDSPPYEVPLSWVWTTLGEITNVGETIKAGTLHDDTWVLDLEDIGKDTSRLVCKVRFSERQSKSDKNIFAAGDVLYGKLRPYLNKVIVADEPGVCTTEILPLRGYGNINADYIKTFLKSPGFIGYVNAKSYGMKMPRLGTTDAKRAYFALPPLAEQSRIVAKVDELMALIDALEAKVGAGETARIKLRDAFFDALASSPDAAATAGAWAQLAPHFDLLLQTPADVDRLQQTLLQLAVKGRLVPQDPNDEPAAELLKRIRAEKARMVAEGKIRHEKPLLAIDENGLPFDVPRGWQWAVLGDVVLSSEAGWSPSCESTPREDSKWGVLKVSAVSWGEFLDEENKALPSHLEARPEYEVQPGDFLLSRANTAELVARSVIAWNPKPHLMLSDKIIRLQIAMGADRTYFNLFNNTSFARTHYVANASGTSASMKNVSRDVVLSLPVPVPPLAEQSRIVAAVASLTALCDRLRERLAARRELSAKLAAAMTEAAVQ